MKKTVIIAAAGSGTRLGAGIPKCLIKIGGRAIFEYQLKAFEWADEIRMVVGYMAEEVIQRVSAINPNVVFIKNPDYSSTTTLQSNFLGAQGLKGNTLFIDGDMLIDQATARQLLKEYESGIPFVGVSHELSEIPVYTGVENGQVQWFSFDRYAEYEWANIAMVDPQELEYNPTHFYVQLEKILPIRAVSVKRLEVDTPEDLQHAERMVSTHAADYELGGNYL